MVFLQKQNPSRKRRSSSSSSFVSPFPPPKIPKSTADAPPPNDAVPATATEKMVSMLAEAGCTLFNPTGPPCVPSDHYKLRRHLHRAFSFSDNAPALRSDFLSGLSSYIQSPKNLHRILVPSRSDGLGSTGESLARHLLLVPSIQLDLQNMLLEKLPEYFHVHPEHSGVSSLSLEDDVARLIVNHFRWLDFIVDPTAFTDKLMQVLSICPLHLKKEIIGSLPEIVGDQSNKTVVASLEQILQEDSAIVVAVLDSFSNLNLDDELQEQVITIALSCIRTIDVEHMPFLLRFLLLSATPANVGRIISQIREQLKFVGLSNSRAMQQKKLKGKSHMDSSEASILDALRSSLRFKNMLCQEILKELNSLQKPRDHKVIDIWLLMLIYMNGESLQKRVEKIFKKKINEDCIQEAMFDQCICGLKDLGKDYFPSFISLSEYLLACKEQKAREFGIRVYTSLFKEFADSYSRQEVLGSLVTLVGSGVGYVVSSALETLGFLASKYTQELIPFSPHISELMDSKALHPTVIEWSVHFINQRLIERLTNQGSLGGIDALLGCPLHLPSSKYLLGACWKSLTGKQKQAVCLSLYYAANWIRELLNAFCTQIAGGYEFTSQSTKEDIIAKLLKRLRNLVFLESLLNYHIGRCTLSLPELHIYMDYSGSSMLNRPHLVKHVEKKSEQNKTNDGTPSDKKRTRKNLSKACTSSDSNEKLRQPTIIDVFRKAGVITSQDAPNENSSGLSSKERSTESSEQQPSDCNEPMVVEITSVAKALEGQRSKFRCLLVQCFSILTLSKGQESCCSDPAAELPLFLYLLRDLHYKLDYSTPRKQFCGKFLSAPIGFTRMTVDQFLSKVRPVFPSLRKHLDSAICLLKEGDETCQEHWKTLSASAGNPDIPMFQLPNSSVSTLVFKEILHCFREIINLPDIQMNKAILLPLLEAFQPVKIPDDFFLDMQLKLSPGTAEYCYFGAYSFVESVLDEACSFSFMLASESLLTLESIATSARKSLDKFREENSNQMHSRIQGALAILCSKLGTSAEKLLKHRWDTEHLENGWKCKGEMVQKILRIYLENSDSTSALLDEIARSILTQELPCERVEEEDNNGFPTLNSATFIVWYRVLHERNLTILNRLVKEVILLAKPRASAQHETVEELLIKLQHSVNVVVSLVTLCRTSDKMTVHAMAVKYGGKFVDSFLKVFDFLQAQFEGHKECIIQMVKELQKATRTIQTLCSEAKGLKQTVITSKIPATKRSMERYLFHVKALLHTTSSGCTFWMGNLKHKDLTGQIVSSQAYVDDQDDNDDTLYPTETVNENATISAASEGDVEAE
ncbi:Fanconi anaemia protein FANCD [Trema orientale]|uniref:Fanconi anaemia protein FANCD n=1 Tax=Trema orientale TaxID=63057 RepID=A0A2P5ER53_TREOI|nr:Fanconi anaemia protein FANCD [Trema orientale]